MMRSARCSKNVRGPAAIRCGFSRIWQVRQISMIRQILIALIVLSVAPPAFAIQQPQSTLDWMNASGPARVWKDSYGKFSVQAILLRVESDRVYLKRVDNGKIAMVPRTRLSDSDNDWLDNWLREANANPETGETPILPDLPPDQPDVDPSEHAVQPRVEGIRSDVRRNPAAHSPLRRQPAAALPVEPGFSPDPFSDQRNDVVAEEPAPEFPAPEDNSPAGSFSEFSTDAGGRRPGRDSGRAVSEKDFTSGGDFATGNDFPASPVPPVVPPAVPGDLPERPLSQPPMDEFGPESPSSISKPEMAREPDSGNRAPSPANAEMRPGIEFGPEPMVNLDWESAARSIVPSDSPTRPEMDRIVNIVPDAPPGAGRPFPGPTSADSGRMADSGEALPEPQPTELEPVENATNRADADFRSGAVNGGSEELPAPVVAEPRPADSAGRSGPPRKSPVGDLSNAELLDKIELNARIVWDRNPALSDLLEPLPPNMQLQFQLLGTPLSEALRVGHIELGQLINQDGIAVEALRIPPSLPDPRQGWVTAIPMPVESVGQAGVDARSPVQHLVMGEISLKRPTTPLLKIQQVAGSLKIVLASEVQDILITSITRKPGPIVHETLKQRNIGIDVQLPDNRTLVVQVTGEVFDVAGISVQVPGRQKYGRARSLSSGSLWFQFTFVEPVPAETGLAIEIATVTRELTIPFDFADMNVPYEEMGGN